MINSLGGSTATYQLQRNKLQVLGWLGDGQTDGRMDGDVMPVPYGMQLSGGLSIAWGFWSSFPQKLNIGKQLRGFFTQVRGLLASQCGFELGGLLWDMSGLAGAGQSVPVCA